MEMTGNFVVLAIAPESLSCEEKEDGNWVEDDRNGREGLQGRDEDPGRVNIRLNFFVLIDEQRCGRKSKFRGVGEERGERMNKHHEEG
ncbi:hypothetical protein HYALB_00011549 [Hymenoscyphus albidus]|uniref:Uncharacterized protein n=1 Tax=Hymenoscyphus albidus TaxID=595503 RepID=A0A9N9LIU9_9HELO|nr:hypothetical protein HYALB_00011549 [Hymenoscyphus albidus]